MQVVTNANMVDLIQGKSIPEFKAPETPAITTEAKVDAPLTEQAKADAEKTATPRGEDGKFVKADEAKANPAVEKTPDADDDVVLTKKIERLINKKHRQMKEAEEFATGEGRRAIEAERRAEQLQREIDALKGTKSGGPNTDNASGDDPNEPKPGDFKTVGEYTRALVKYEAKRAGETGKAMAVQSKQQAQANELVGAFVERQEAFKKATPDYEDVVGSTDLIVPNIAMQYLIESDVGPQLGYYLAKNPDEVTRLQTLSPSRCIAELGKLETKLEKPATPAKVDANSNGVSRAPAPIQPLEAKSTPVTKDPKDMNFQELRAHREAEKRAKAH